MTLTSMQPDLDTIRADLALGLPLTADEGRALVHEIDLLRRTIDASFQSRLNQPLPIGHRSTSQMSDADG